MWVVLYVYIRVFEVQLLSSRDWGGSCLGSAQLYQIIFSTDCLIAAEREEVAAVLKECYPTQNISEWTLCV